MTLTSFQPRRAAIGAAAVILFAASAAAPAAAQDFDSIDSLAHSFKAEHQPPGLVIGYIDSAGTRILPYGVARQGDSAGVTGDTRFEIGSITKVFTSLLLANMVERGEVELDDPIAHYLPDSVHAPDYRGQAIVLRELSTHTSGLPRLASNMSPPDMTDPYAHYTADKLYAFLDAYDLPRTPDSHFEYSNLGAGLLGFLLARQADTSYAALLTSRILEPLQLHNTYIGELDGGTDSLMAFGYADGKQTPFWHFGVLAGAGGLRSSASDMLRFIAEELDPSSTPLASAVELSQKIRYHVSPQLALALGWQVSTLPDSTQFYWHNGGTGGGRSFVGFAPDRSVGVVVLTNSGIPLNAFNQFAMLVAREAMQH